MKKHDLLKIIQLIVFIILTAVCFYCIVLNPEIYHLIAQDAHIRLVCVLLWITLGLSFLFILLDFNFSSAFKKDYRELDYAVHSDPLSGLANRLSADAMIEKYLNKPVPDDFACVMIDLANIRETNELYGHLAGNTLIREFSDMLNTASVGLCYVARNGGNKFLAIFEKTDENHIAAFLRNVTEEVKKYNDSHGACPIYYRVGVAFHEEKTENLKSVPDLIALANKRIYEKD